MSKYEPLTAFLKKQPNERVQLSFREVERVLGFKLPASALKHRPWWANTGGAHVQSQAWIEAGFQTEAVDMDAKRLVFRRTPSAEAPNTRARSIDAVYGCLARTIRILGDVARPSHEIWRDPDSEA